MIPLEELHPKTAEADITLVNGKKITVTLRPYSMADHVWYQENFSKDEEAMAIAAMQIDAIAKVAWHMMDSESKRFFGDVRYKQFNEETGEDDDVDVVGHEKLVHTIKGEESFWKLFDAFCRCRGMNGFIEDPNKIGVKKKAMKKQRPRSIGQIPLISWLRNMGIRRRKSSSLRPDNFNY